MKKGPFLLLCLVALLQAIVLVHSPAQAAGEWADNFDTYATGADLHGMGGWKGFSNDPTYTAFTTDLRARSAPNSMEIAGNSDLVHEYSVTSGRYRFHFYQYIPSVTLGTFYFIMLNRYDDTGNNSNWSVQVRHVGLSGLIIDDGTGNSLPMIRNQWVEVCVEIDLEDNTQTYYYNGQWLYTGSWSEHISGAGTTAIGAVSLFANGAGPVFYDDMSLRPWRCSAEVSTSYLPAVIQH